MARPQKPYFAPWLNEYINGLTRAPDGRWRIMATGERFREPDERQAVLKFWAKTGQNDKVALLPVADMPASGANVDQMQIAAGEIQESQQVFAEITEDNQIVFSRALPENAFWALVRKELVERPAYAAKMTGLPELVNFRSASAPKPSIRLSRIIEVYQRDNPAKAKSKQEALAVFNKLIAFSNAKTLDDLTQEVLSAFRSKIEKEIDGPATRAAYYNRIKYIISFGLKVGLDQEQIRAALDRCKILWTAAAMPPVQPKPISRDHFHKLLEVGGLTWRPWLLLGLNLCMSVEEICGLRWEWFDLDKGTFACIREKTRRKRIPRAATLWPETLQELNKLTRRGPYVFISTHGTRYNRNTRVNDFADLRKKAKLPESITFGCLRDGAYTVACHTTTDERQARVLAGHVAPGLADHYVLRNPEIVRPACVAVYNAYGPFTKPQVND